MEHKKQPAPRSAVYFTKHKAEQYARSLERGLNSRGSDSPAWPQFLSLHVARLEFKPIRSTACRAHNRFAGTSGPNHSRGESNDD